MSGCERPAPAQRSDIGEVEIEASQELGQLPAATIAEAGRGVYALDELVQSRSHRELLDEALELLLTGVWMDNRAARVTLYAGQLKVHNLRVTVRHSGVRDNRLVAGEIHSQSNYFIRSILISQKWIEMIKKSQSNRKAFTNKLKKVPSE